MHSRCPLLEIADPGHLEHLAPSAATARTKPGGLSTGEGQEPAASSDGAGDGDVRVMMADTRLPLWSTRPNLFQLVADLRGIAPIRRAVAGRPRFASCPPRGRGRFLER